MQEQRLGSRYVLTELIGRGAMGSVYRARVDGPDGHGSAAGTVVAEVAVKLLRDELCSDLDEVDRFLREGRLLRSVDHPNVVRIRDLVAEGDQLGIVMDLVESGDLRRAVQMPCPESTAAGLVAAIADGLTAVHAAGIVHRDLKPENVLVERTLDGLARPRISDFGISRLDTVSASLSRGITGTVGYIAPEVTRGDPATPEIDVYALGVILYELCVGHGPFRAANHLAMIVAHAEAPVPRPPAMSDAVWDLVSRMLDKDPAGRPSAAEVARRARAVTATYSSPWDATPPGWCRLPTTEAGAPWTGPDRLPDGPRQAAPPDAPDTVAGPEPTTVAGPRGFLPPVPGQTRGPAQVPPPAPVGSSGPAPSPLPVAGMPRTGGARGRRGVLYGVTAAAAAVTLAGGSLVASMSRSPEPETQVTAVADPPPASGAPAGSSPPADLSPAASSPAVPSPAATTPAATTTPRPTRTTPSPRPPAEAAPVRAVTGNGKQVATPLSAGKRYRLRNVATDKCAGRIGSAVQQHGCGSVAAQQSWVLQRTRGADVPLYWLRSGDGARLCLGVKGDGPVEAGTPIKAERCSPAKAAARGNDEWKLQDVGKDGRGRRQYAIVNWVTGLCLDVSFFAADRSDAADGLNLTLFTCQSTPGDWDDHLWVFA